MSTSHLVEQARRLGLVWLRDQVLQDPTAPDHLPTLLAVLRLDLADPGDHTRRLGEYRRVFDALRNTPEGRKAVEGLEMDLAVRVVRTPRPVAVERWLNPDAVTDQTPPPQLIHRSMVVEKSSPANPDVPELDPRVAAELGFADLTRLGQGGFGTVYAARQTAVGNRLVAIKYTTARSREPQVLAALQHPNIMPVWSVHEHAGHRVFCMPLHGRTTVADVLRMIDHTKSLPATGAGFLSVASARSVTAVEAVTATDPDVEMPPNESAYESDRKRMEKLGYVDSVVRGMTRLADALAHAHRRRVVHLDIKPANILITDDGELMILDFGLAYQNGVAASPEAGGTVRYMAPEHLSAFVAGQKVRPDPRMDLYSLGLVFFELLTGRHPFAESLAPGVRREEWVAARHRHPPRVRRFNPGVPPGVEAIVLKLLHPDRAVRYQSAEQLVTDLTRHQDNQPLVYAGNPSVRERFRKFRRRHPVFSVTVMAGILAVLAAAGFWAAKRNADQAWEKTVASQTAHAQKRLGELQEDMTAIRIDAASMQSPDARRRAIERVKSWRAEYGLDAGCDWHARTTYDLLDPDRRRAVSLALGEQALLVAHAERLNAIDRDPAESTAALERAVEWNRRAEAAFAPDGPPNAVGEQRAELAELLGRALPELPPTGPDEPIDLFFRGLGRIATGEYTRATEPLQELVRRSPQHAAGHFALGYVDQTLNRHTPAVEQYEVAKALAKNDPRPAFNRGSLLLLLRNDPDAETDLTTALDRDPDLTEAYYLRAVARYRLGKREDALADIDHAVRHGGPSYRFLALRASIRAAAGDDDGAAQDRAALDRITPTDAQDLLARGSRHNSDAVAAEKRGDATAAEEKRLAAVADFRAAAELNPLCATAWNNLAAVQAQLDQTADAADSLAKLIVLMPEHTSAKFLRAVLLARLTKRNEAVNQIRELTPGDANTWYQRAAVYALNADVFLDDLNEVVRSLRKAAQLGFTKWDEIDTDADFEKVRDVEAVRTLIETKGQGEQ